MGEPEASLIRGCSERPVWEVETRGRRILFTLRPVDLALTVRAAGRAGCSTAVWLRALVESRLADERALERDLARIEAALAREDRDASAHPPKRPRGRPPMRRPDPSPSP